jgi:hypothetical protein
MSGLKKRTLIGNISFPPQVRELREIVQKHGLENRDGADINGVKAPEAQLARLGELVETVNSIHSRALRMEGGTAAGLVSASVERCARRQAQVPVSSEGTPPGPGLQP